MLDFTIHLLNASTTVYTSTHDASTPNRERVSVHSFSMFFKFLFCFEAFVTALEFLFLHLFSLKTENSSNFTRTLLSFWEMVAVIGYIKCDQIRSG